jgi:hypothetical protein
VPRQRVRRDLARATRETETVSSVGWCTSRVGVIVGRVAPLTASRSSPVAPWTLEVTPDTPLGWHESASEDHGPVGRRRCVDHQCAAEALGSFATGSICPHLKVLREAGLVDRPTAGADPWERSWQLVSRSLCWTLGETPRLGRSRRPLGCSSAADDRKCAPSGPGAPPH